MKSKPIIIVIIICSFGVVGYFGFDYYQTEQQRKAQAQKELAEKQTQEKEQAVRQEIDLLVDSFMEIYDAYKVWGSAVSSAADECMQEVKYDNFDERLDFCIKPFQRKADVEAGISQYSMFRRQMQVVEKIITYSKESKNADLC